MSKKKRSSLAAQRAWDLLRALLWARKGELCRNKLALALTIFHKLIRRIVHSDEPRGRTGALLYGDHEFSFGNTPVVHVRMHRAKTTLPFRMPCIAPRVDDRGVDEDEDDYDDAMWCDRLCDGSDEGIDRKAEEFIAKFYEEMKLQRQISYM